MKTSKETIGVLLNIYSRPQNTKSLVQSYLKQTRTPLSIHCQIETQFPTFNACKELDSGLSELRRDADKLGSILTWSFSNLNSGVWGRFFACKAIDCDYILISDDDTYPGQEWLASCFETSKLYDCACTTYGLRFKKDSIDYFENDVYGWQKPSPFPECVDFMGHSWFLRKQWLDALSMYGLNIFYKRSGEDLFISHYIKNVIGKPIIVPEHPVDRQELWGSTHGYEYGCGNEAISMDRSAASLFRMQFANVRFIGYYCIDDSDEEMLRLQHLNNVVRRSPDTFVLSGDGIKINRLNSSRDAIRLLTNEACDRLHQLRLMAVNKDFLRKSLPYMYLREVYQWQEVL